MDHEGSGGVIDAVRATACAREFASWARLLARARLDGATEAQRATLDAAADIARSALHLEEQFGCICSRQGWADIESPAPARSFPTVSDVAPIRESGLLETLLAEPHTLAAIAASACVCDHPAHMWVAFEAHVDRVATPAVSCAACGAMGLSNEDAEGDLEWIRPSIVSLVTRALLLEIDEVASGLSCGGALRPSKRRAGVRDP
jgi:hypothetical protein